MAIIFYIISLVILYFVIETAVRNGINSSVIGKIYEEKYEKNDASRKAKKSFLDNDLDD